MSVRVENGRILVSFGDDDEELAPVEARALANELIDAADECERQQEQIQAACASGHLWGSGINGVKLGDGAKVTVQHCERDGCRGYQELPGWIEYAPALHIDPMTGRQLSCYGPGCDYCAAARLGQTMRDMVADAYVRLVEALGQPGEVSSAFAAVSIELVRNDNANSRLQ